MTTYDTWNGSWGTSWALTWTRSRSPVVVKDVDAVNVIFRTIKKRKKKPHIIDMHAAQERHSAALKASIAELFFPKPELPSIPDSYDPVEVVALVFTSAMKPGETAEPELIIPPEHHELELLLLLA